MLMLWRRRENLIEKLCRESGRWIITGREGDTYQLRGDDANTVRYLTVRHREDVCVVKFQGDFSMSFPIDATPPGLFARMLMRNTALSYVHWSITLQGSCEAVPYLIGLWPVSALDATSFDAACREIVAELLAFHREVIDKFRGGMGRPVEDACRNARYVPDRPVLPIRRAESLADQRGIRFLQ